MCQTTLFQHKTCGHTWALITEPCGPGMGFLVCDTFGTSTIKTPPSICKTKSRPCPRCLRDQHGWALDPNCVRVVKEFGGGVKWGTGPRQEDWGCEVKCRDGICVVL